MTTATMTATDGTEITISNIPEWVTAYAAYKRSGGVMPLEVWLFYTKRFDTLRAVDPTFS